MSKDKRHEFLKGMKDTPAGGEKCPNGHIAMWRLNERNQTVFIGCSEWPKCTFSRSLDGQWHKPKERVGRSRAREHDSLDEFISTDGRIFDE